MRCLWCSSPQTWNPEPELIFFKYKCIGCMNCAKICPNNAIVAGFEKRIDRNQCNNCGMCAEVCPSKALKLDGQLMSVDEVMEIVLKDWSFYRKSGGGVTLSGGEPTLQPKFAVSLLEKCREKGIHTAMETSGHVEWGKFATILKYLNLVLIDLKHMDPTRHLELTGVSNDIILANIYRIAKEKLCSIWIEFPLIPRYNDSESNINAMLDFLRSVSIDRVRILPFHKLGQHEYEEMGLEYKVRELASPDEQYIDRIKERFLRHGIRVDVVH